MATANFYNGAVCRCHRQSTVIAFFAVDPHYHRRRRLPRCPVVHRQRRSYIGAVRVIAVNRTRPPSVVAYLRRDPSRLPSPQSERLEWCKSAVRQDRRHCRCCRHHTLRRCPRYHHRRKAQWCSQPAQRVIDCRCCRHRTSSPVSTSTITASRINGAVCSSRRRLRRCPSSHASPGSW